MTRAPSAPPAGLRSIRGGVTARDPVTAAAPKHLSALATKIYHELSRGVFRTTTQDMVNCSILAKFCEAIATAWGSAHGADGSELAQGLADGLKLSPASRRRLERLAASKSKNEKTSDELSQWS